MSYESLTSFYRQNTSDHSHSARFCDQNRDRVARDGHGKDKDLCGRKHEEGSVGFINHPWRPASPRRNFTDVRGSLVSWRALDYIKCSVGDTSCIELLKSFSKDTEVFRFPLNGTSSNWVNYDSSKRRATLRYSCRFTLILKGSHA